MRVDLSDRALREMQRIDLSWRKRASSPDVFLDELEEFVEMVETTGVSGPVYAAKANAESLKRQCFAATPKTAHTRHRDEAPSPE